jgi:hypothetical protein
MEKTSKVTNVAGIGTWNGQYGVICTNLRYRFEMANQAVHEQKAKSKPNSK